MGFCTLGPGTHVDGGLRGAACLLAAFRRCRPADYVLTGFAGGEVVVVSFSVEHWAGSCAVLVLRRAGTDQPRGDPPIVTGPRICRGVRTTRAGIVADRCTRGKPAVIPLTTFT